MANCRVSDKGLIDLAYRSGQVASIQAQTVYENDYFDYSFGLEPTLKHIPADVERGELKAVYAVIKLKDGGYAFDVMSVEDIRRHAKQYSKAYSSGFSPWATSFEEMAKKTVLKRVLKYAPLKSEFARAVAADETVKSELSADMTDVADETVYEISPEDYDVTDDSIGAEDVEA